MKFAVRLTRKAFLVIQAACHMSRVCYLANQNYPINLALFVKIQVHVYYDQWLSSCF